MDRRQFAPHQEIAPAPGMQVGESRLGGVFGERFDQCPAVVPVHGLEAMGVGRVGEQDSPAASRIDNPPQPSQPVFLKPSHRETLEASV